MTHYDTLQPLSSVAELVHIATDPWIYPLNLVSFCLCRRPPLWVTRLRCQSSRWPLGSCPSAWSIPVSTLGWCLCPTDGWHQFVNGTRDNSNKSYVCLWHYSIVTLWHCSIVTWKVYIFGELEQLLLGAQWTDNTQMYNCKPYKYLRALCYPGHM